MTKKQKLQVLIDDLRAVGKKHNTVLDKYVKEKGSTEYFFKLQFEDAEVNIEDVFHTVYHGPPV
jgi:hypothetical protein